MMSRWAAITENIRDGVGDPGQERVVVRGHERERARDLGQDVQPRMTAP